MRDGCADLHGYAFSSRAAAKEMRGPRAQHNERHQTWGDGVLASVAYVEHQTHAAVGALAPGAVGKHDGKARKSEKGEQQRDVRVPEGANCQEHTTKKGTDGANDNADRDSDGAHEHETAIGVDQAFNPARCAAF